jgi:hypothetical protein
MHSLKHGPAVFGGGSFTAGRARHGRTLAHREQESERSLTVMLQLYDSYHINVLVRAGFIRPYRRWMR